MIIADFYGGKGGAKGLLSIFLCFGRSKRFKEVSIDDVTFCFYKFQSKFQLRIFRL